MCMIYSIALLVMKMMKDWVVRWQTFILKYSIIGTDLRSFRKKRQTSFSLLRGRKGGLEKTDRIQVLKRLLCHHSCGGLVPMLQIYAVVFVAGLLERRYRLAHVRMGQ